MEGMTEQDKINFVKAAVQTLNNQKKEEVMKCVGQFVYNPKIAEINKQIESFQKQCPHDGNMGTCSYCGKKLSQVK